MNKVSIIVPVYNSEKTIMRCLNSILGQTYKNFEVIIINDGSTDNSKKIIESIVDERIILINKKNEGVSAARNDGIKKCKGEYVCFIDSDDTYEKDFVSCMLNSIISTNSDICVANVNYIDNKKIYSPLKIKNEIINKNDFIIKIAHELKGFVANKMYKKTVLNNNFFNTDFSIFEDLLFNLEVCKNVNSVVTLSNTLYNYYQYDYSAINEKNLNNYNRKIIGYKKITEYILNNYPNVVQEYSYEFLKDLESIKFEIKKMNELKLLKEINDLNNNLKSHLSGLSLRKKFELFLYRRFYCFICILKKIRRGLK